MNKFELMNRIREELNIEGLLHLNMEDRQYDEQEYQEIKESIASILNKIKE